MADSITFELVSPERLLATAEVAAVTVPGIEGDMTAMPNHAPALATLRPGYVTTDGGDRYFVTGGLVEISGEAVSVLAEEAFEADAVTGEWLRERIEAAETALAEAGEDRREIEQQKLNDFRNLVEGKG